MDDSAAWLAFKDQLQAHYQALEAYHKELGGDYEDSSSSLMDVLQAALQASLEATKAECDRVREDCESMLRDMTRMRMAMGEVSRVTGADDPFSSFGTRTRIKAPLLDSQKVLRIEHTAARKAFAERADKVVEMYARLRSYLEIIPASTINFSVPEIDDENPPDDVTLAKLGQLDAAVAQCKQEVSRRKKQVQEHAREIVQLWAELAVKSETIDSALDRAILLDAQSHPETLGLMDEDLDNLEQKKLQLQAEKTARKEIIDGRVQSIRTLHRKLRLPEADLTSFCSRVRGVGEPAILLCEQELARLEELKKDHIEDFIKDARETLEELWNALYYDENDKLEFTPAFTETYTDASLQAHENEIEKLQKRVAELEPLLALIAKHMALAQEKQDLEIQVSDPARFSKRGYNPMAESKLRARIENMMPKVEETLREALNSYEEAHAVPFRVWGEIYLDATAPARKPISRHEPTAPLRQSVSKKAEPTNKLADTASKTRPKTPGLNARPASSTATPLKPSHVLARSIGSNRPSSNSPTKMRSASQDRLGRSVLKERPDSNTAKVPCATRPVASKVTLPQMNSAKGQLPRMIKTSQSIRPTQIAPSKMIRPVTMSTREVSGSSTSSQVSTENWDAYQQDYSDEEPDDHRMPNGTMRSAAYDRAKTTELLTRHKFEPASSTHSRDGLVESPLQHVVEEGSFIDDWEGEGF